MKKITLFCLLFLLSMGFVKADEGMWIPSLIQELNEKEMQDLGMNLSAEDIYSVNHSSLKDAIVKIPGCTAEIVSEQGLILTNHHCGYGRIQAHSTLDHDYLTDGFWAMNKSEELPNKGMYARLLISIEDVSDEVLSDLASDLSEADRSKEIQKRIKVLVKEATKDTHYDAFVRPFYYGNKYYLFLNETFKDVRLVGAPPSNIGKFGGDTDNWMWPRHTGDFSVFRIYADTNNLPAEYSEHNIPYTPKNYLKISMKGVDEGDFTMVFGYPGRTQEYLPSYGVKLNTEILNPIRINLRTERLNIFKREIEKNKKVRIQYASKSAGVANGWKKWQGETRGIRRFDAVGKKVKFEKEFIAWAKADESRNELYGSLIADFEKSYDAGVPLQIANTYVREAGYGIEIVRFASRFASLLKKDSKNDSKAHAKRLKSLKSSTEKFFKDYYQPIDEEVFVALLKKYKNEVPVQFLPDFFNRIQSKYKGDYQKYAAFVFKKSIFTSEEKVLKVLNNKKANYKAFEKDPVMKIVLSLKQMENTMIKPDLNKLNAKVLKLQRYYMKAQMEMQPNRRFYPDANSTIRVHYGQVKAFVPMDAVNYKHFTTLEGILEKENPDVYDYVVEQKLKELFNNKDYGRYADKDGKIHVCFIAANHTSGGNSGSPILNADGQLLGLNFDRNWEGTMSDLSYDPSICRNISVDIRYVLFIIDKFAGAGHLVDEMTLVE